MRLEDWQRWLDTQFIDPAEAQPERETTAPAEESIATEPAPPGGAAQQAVAATAAGAVAVLERPSEPAAAATATFAPPALKPEPIDTPPDDAESPAPVAPQQRPTHVEDPQIPSLEQYMPFLRQRVSAPEPEPVAAESAPAEDVVEETITAREMLSVDVETRVVETVSETESGSPESPSGQAELPLSEADAPSRPRPRYQLSHRRARHARNVQLAEVGQELKEGELWNLVPKHIQTLVAIGSDNDEIAQNSYKRGFRESRIELISRLLDPTLSLEETARILNVCPTTVRRYTNKGLLTHQRTLGDQRRFKLSDVLAFLEAQSRAGGSA